ncbi:MAG: SGNH/GDSL hydrolase family protein [Planctomycetes bacterium]|nr:SGNH/GDSL hydrolase family protein [Planctomycetota bacterium]
MIVRLLVSVVAAIVALLLAEGAWSLVTGRSLVHPAPLARMQALDAERIAAAARTVGPFAADEDPVVGFHVKGSAAREFLGVAASTDRFGMRARLGGDPADDAVRIAILGDSVAFGFGVPDGQTLGHHLEELLATAMGPNTARPFVTTVACPGWNFQNQARYLQDHLARIDPDIVVMLPIGNDLDDGFGVDEAGQRSWPQRPGAPFVGVEVWTGFVLERWKRHGENIAGTQTWPLLMSGLSPESERRWSAYLRAIDELRDRLERHGAPLLVAFSERDEFARVLHERLTRELPGSPVMGLHGPREAEDCIANDPHPNGRWHRESARRIARRLIESGWLVGADAAALPPGDPRYADRGFEPTEWSVPEEYRAAWGALYGDRFDLAAGAGLWQVYGGVHPADGTVGVGCFLGLRKPGARRLVATIRPLDRASGVYPVVLTWRSGTSVIAKTPIADSTRIVTVDLPADLGSDGRVDITIEPDNWVVEEFEGRSRLAAFRLERLELR